MPLKELRIRGTAVAFIDWANVYGWSKSLGYETNPIELFQYFKKYTEIRDLRFYFGKDAHPKSIEFVEKIAKCGFSLVSKPVKYLPVGILDGKNITRRKCDFDIEISIDVHRLMYKENVESFVFLSGDGDLAPLYQLLIDEGKQVIVIYAKNHIGREIWEIKKGLFKIQMNHLSIKNIVPPVSQGA